jgi:WD40 repeat protein
MRVFDLPISNAPDALAFSPDSWLLAVWAFGQVFLIDTTAGMVRTLQPRVDWIMYGAPGVGFTPDGRGVIAFHNLGAGRQVAVRVYDVTSGEVRRTLEGRDLDAMEPAVGGRLVYLASADERQTEIVAWDPVTGKKKPGFGRHLGFLRQLAVSADGQWVAGSSAKEVRVWDLGGGKRPTRAARKVRAVKWLTIDALALSADGAFVSAGGSGVVVWDVRTGAEQRVAERFGARGHALGFHPNRPLLAYPQGGDGVVFWDVESRSELQRFAWGIGSLSALAFGPDGMRCAAGSKGKVVVWDVDL